MTKTFAVLLAIAVMRAASVGSADAAVCGDADGNDSVTVTDGVQVLRAAAGLSTGCTNERCDVDGSGGITVTDGVNVLRKAAGLSIQERCPSAHPAFLDMRIEAGNGFCGTITPGGLAPKHLLDPHGNSLSCGGLAIGGGLSTVTEVLVPSGTTTRFGLGNCRPDGSCDLSGVTLAETVGGVEGSTTGASFGAPVPILIPDLNHPDDDTPALSACIHTVFAHAASGTVNLATGSLTLKLILTVDTWVPDQATLDPCPKCDVPGGPPAAGEVKTGTCDSGANFKGECTTVNPGGLSADCLPRIGDQLPSFEIQLTPTTIEAPPTTPDADGFFCPRNSEDPTGPGCFGGDADQCHTIAVHGAPATGPLTVDIARAAALASVFCIPGELPPIGNAASLPGPGALTLAVTVTARP